MSSRHFAVSFESAIHCSKRNQHRMKGSHETSGRLVAVRLTTMLLLAMGISRCTGLSLGWNPLALRNPAIASVQHRGTTTMLLGASREGSNVRLAKMTSSCRNGYGTPLIRVRKKHGTRLNGKYLDYLDRQSGKDFHYWEYRPKKKTNTTELVDKMQVMVDSTPGPFSRIVSKEMW